ncbi:MAG: signal peptide peptidase SppA, partial [Alistipes sp.]|nr:signal peptide peptidase SppA [Alistipes sp.]
DSPSVSALGSFNAQSMSIDSSITSLQMLSAIEHAAMDENIEGIYIYLNGNGTIETALLEELRSALERFKLSGKFIVAFDDNYTQGEYYLASVADRVSLHPEGMLDWSGLRLSSMFFKGLLDRLDIEVDVLRPSDCKYKSAGEPYFLTKMSDANRAQMQALADSMWQNLVNDVAKSRGIEPQRVKTIAENIDIYNAQTAKEYGFIDAIEYEDEMDNYLEELGVKRSRSGELEKITLSDYCAANAMFDPELNLNPSKNRVGIIYADGQIVDGTATGDGYIFGNTLAKQIREARLDDDIKAVVLRVNSPGGSALASDVIWREVVLLQQTKPVVVSMGCYAASGGYYISVPADYIFADRLTLTGSIGVIGTLFNAEKFLSSHLGITTDYTKTSENAGGIDFTGPMSPRTKQIVLNSIDATYDTFTSHVADGRNLSKENVLSVAEGRVWSGSEATGIGLVDANGGLFEAITKAANLADLSNYSLKEIKLPLTPFEAWLKSVGMATAKSMGIDYNIYGNDLNSLIEENLFIFTNSGIQMISPMNIKVQL